MKYIVITGVSSGIGLETAKYLLDRGYFVFGSVRDKSSSQLLQEQLGLNFYPLIFDVRDINSINQSVEVVKNIISDNTITGLVNNAGIAVSGPIQYIDQQELLSQFDINVIGLLNTTRAFLPLLGARKEKVANPGRIVNISSVAGTFTMPFQTLYSASKYAVESITDGLRRELDIYGIKVISIRPGPIKSAIWSKEMRKSKIYEGTIYQPIFEKKDAILKNKLAGASPTILVSEVILKAIESPKPKLRYLVYKKHFLYYFSRMLPSRWADKIVKSQIEKIKNSKTTKAPW